MTQMGPKGRKNWPLSRETVALILKAGSRYQYLIYQPTCPLRSRTISRVQRKEVPLVQDSKNFYVGLLNFNILIVQVYVPHVLRGYGTPLYTCRLTSPQALGDRNNGISKHIGW
ncbi:hypothetical protein CBL_07760 [Carabus blaptoides fortunei]